MTETQIKLIEAAEHEFALRGYHGASVREITRRAGANVAAINYHFGSKETLFVEMIRFRIEPINELRFQLLEAALTRSSGAPLKLPELIDILVRPLVEKYLDQSAVQNSYFLKALGRGMTEESGFMINISHDILAKLIERFTAELARIYDDQPKENISKCFYFISTTLSGFMQFQIRNQFLAIPASFSSTVDDLVRFVSAGIESLVAHYRASINE